MLRNPSCGARKNPRETPSLFLDFFDRYAHPCSLHLLRSARRRCPRLNRRSGSTEFYIKITDTENDVRYFGAEGGI